MSTQSNKNLHKANKAKNDEFYTQISDIEKELKDYKKHFKDKVIFCNCDDPKESHFFKYFALKFKDLELKKLISTHFETTKPSYKLEVVKDINKDGKIDEKDAIRTDLKQNGDFRSPECIKILRQKDIIVVTNPPFSLFREYVVQLIKYRKKFIIIGNKNAITYKEIFKLIKDNKIWLGYTSPKEFMQPDGTMGNLTGLTRWFTNLKIKKRNEDLILTERYNKKKYPKYDNYNVINVNKVKEIPKDYKGVMGVPITFMDSYNPKQFEMLGIANSARWIGYECFTIIKGKKIYNRILIKNKKIMLGHSLYSGNGSRMNKPIGERSVIGNLNEEKII